ncbi:MAG TPA: hypothetical protein VJY62_09695 [Bacteroidia bacterium]|nr:hypothetical protein [Bacteroidia bacterium]
MEVLNKTIKKLSDAEYDELVMQVAGKKRNKPYLILEASRSRDVSDDEMMEMLQVNPGAYYTLKSRLNNKIAAVLSNKVQSPVNILMNEVAKIPAHLLGTNREFSIRALVDLEKQLIEYDLSTELILVYKTLAQLNLYTDDYTHYDNLYKRHVAFSLAVGKAENILFRFIRKMGTYLLTLEREALEDLILLKRELSNICEMYDSHRLFVFYSIVNIYYQCNVLSSRDSLKSQEMEIESTLQKMTATFEKYSQDTFYQSIRFIVDFLYFEYYQKTQNQVRADFYLERIHPLIPNMCPMHAMNFYIIQCLNTKVEKYLNDQNLESLVFLNPSLAPTLDINMQEEYHYISLKKFLAVSKFYQGDFSGAAKTMNELRNNISLKKYLHCDIESKLFQALQYCIMGEDGLCHQIISSVKRQISENEQQWESASLFIKLLKSALKPLDYRKKIKRVNEIWIEFTEKNNAASHPVLRFVKLDEALMRKMANPIKE